ncbi:hypothetical protein E8E11_005021 [Didymella keratinophila]|nr:hypothetical protein E8E11_005021 [Didymella keratinophila]
MSITTDEFGAIFPRARVYGVALSPVPTVRPQRENVEYIQGDILDLADPGGDERLAKHSFDYVFSRALIAGMNKWDEYFKLCVALAKPGGWIEMHEPDITLHLTPPASGNPYDKYSRAPSLEELRAEAPSADEDPESWRVALQGLFRARGLDPSIGSHLP